MSTEQATQQPNEKEPAGVDPLVVTFFYSSTEMMFSGKNPSVYRRDRNDVYRLTNNWRYDSYRLGTFVDYELREMKCNPDSW